jgi:hypothetical protein
MCWHQQKKLGYVVRERDSSLQRPSLDSDWEKGLLISSMLVSGIGQPTNYKSTDLEAFRSVWEDSLCVDLGGLSIRRGRRMHDLHVLGINSTRPSSIRINFAHPSQTMTFVAMRMFHTSRMASSASRQSPRCREHGLEDATIVRMLEHGRYEAASLMPDVPTKRNPVRQHATRRQGFWQFQAASAIASSLVHVTASLGSALSAYSTVLANHTQHPTISTPCAQASTQTNLRA